LSRTTAAATSGARIPMVMPEELSKRWGISIQTSKNTMKVTTQRGMQYSTQPLHRRWRTGPAHLRYPILKTTVYSDTLFVTAKYRAGIGGDKCAQVFTTPFDHIRFYPMKLKAQAGEKLDQYVQDICKMEHLHTDGAKEEADGLWGRTVKYHHIRQTLTEPFSSSQNRAEIGIRDLRRGIRFHSRRKNSPCRLWNYLGGWYADKKVATASSLPDRDGRTPHEVLTGNTIRDRQISVS
jgi:hypothetical protein